MVKTNKININKANLNAIIKRTDQRKINRNTKPGTGMIEQNKTNKIIKTIKEQRIERSKKPWSKSQTDLKHK